MRSFCSHWSLFFRRRYRWDKKYSREILPSRMTHSSLSETLSKQQLLLKPPYRVTAVKNSWLCLHLFVMKKINAYRRAISLPLDPFQLIHKKLRLIRNTIYEKFKRIRWRLTIALPLDPDINLSLSPFKITNKELRLIRNAMYEIIDTSVDTPKNSKDIRNLQLFKMTTSGSLQNYSLGITDCQSYDLVENPVYSSKCALENSCSPENAIIPNSFADLWWPHNRLNYPPVNEDGISVR